MANVQTGSFPVFRSCKTTTDERLIREFILQCKLGHISTTYFQNKFGVDVRERFATPLNEIKAMGYLNDSGEHLTFTRNGLLRVDWLLHETVLKYLASESGA